MWGRGGGGGEGGGGTQGGPCEWGGEGGAAGGVKGGERGPGVVGLVWGEKCGGLKGWREGRVEGGGQEREEECAYVGKPAGRESRMGVQAKNYDPSGSGEDRE